MHNMILYEFTCNPEWVFECICNHTYCIKIIIIIIIIIINLSNIY